MGAAVMSTTQRQKFKESQEVDLAYSVPGLGRFRCNIFQQRGTVGLVLRVIPMQIRTIDELGLPQVLKTIAAGGARARPRHRHHRQRQEHDARRDDRLHQQDALRARDDGRGSDRVPAPRQQVDGEPARGRGRHALLRAGAAQRAAPGSGRDSGRRDARLRDDRDRPAGGRDRPPGVLHAAHARRDRDDQPHHLGVSAAPAEADPAAARQRAEGGRLAAPDAEDRRQGTRAGGRGADQHPVHPRLHRRQGKDAHDPRRDRRGHVAVRHAVVRPVDLQPVRAGAGLARGSAALGEQRRRVQAEGAGDLDDLRDEPRPDGQERRAARRSRASARSARPRRPRRTGPDTCLPPTSTASRCSDGASCPRSRCASASRARPTSRTRSTRRSRGCARSARSTISAWPRRSRAWRPASASAARSASACSSSAPASPRRPRSRRSTACSRGSTTRRCSSRRCASGSAAGRRSPTIASSSGSSAISSDRGSSRTG